MQKDLKKLPRRDYFILPLISLLTVLIMLGGAEVIARLWFVADTEGNCGIKDRLHGYRFSPNCVSYGKAAEGPRVQYIYNECGYRTIETCGAKPTATIRVALMGASTSQGFKVPYQQAFAPRVAAGLTKQCGRPVEFQNMGVAGYKPIDQYWLMDEALSMKPDLIMLVVTPYELVDIIEPKILENRRTPEVFLKEKTDITSTHKPTTLVSVIDAAVSDSRAVLAAQHTLYQNREKYISLFLMHGDKADYLRPPLSSKWENRLESLDLLLGEIAEKAHAVNVPFALAVSPQRIQTALMDIKLRPIGVDPFLIGSRLAKIAKRHGIIYFDSLEYFGTKTQPEQLFYPVDGHMTETGHAVFAESIEHWLLNSDVQLFNQCSPDSRSNLPQELPL